MKINVNTKTLRKQKDEILNMKHLDHIVENYLTEEERNIFEIYVLDDAKHITDIRDRLNINDVGSWYSYSMRIDRVFRIIKMYDLYHNIDIEELNKTLIENLSFYEIDLLACMFNRMTFHEVKDHIGSYYKKVYFDTMGAVSKIEKINDSGKQFAEFLRLTKTVRTEEKNRERRKLKWGNTK